MATHEGEGAGGAGAQVVGGDEGNVGREDFSDLLVQQFVEAGRVLGDVANGLCLATTALTAEAQRGVVALAAGMLNENECRRHFEV